MIPSSERTSAYSPQAFHEVWSLIKLQKSVGDITFIIPPAACASQGILSLIACHDIVLKDLSNTGCGFILQVHLLSNQKDLPTHQQI